MLNKYFCKILCILMLFTLLTGCNESVPAQNSVGENYASSDSAKLDNYIETEILLDREIKNNNEQYLTMLLNENRNMDLYAISQENAGDSSFVWAYTLKDGKWERKAVSWLDGLKSYVSQKRINVLLGADGEYYAHYVDNTELSHLVKKVDNGFVEIPMPDWDKTKEREYKMIPDQVAVLENGNIVMASRQKKCYVYDKNNGEVINTFPCGWYTSLYTIENNIIILDKDNKSFLVYDANQNKIVNTLKGNFNGRALLCRDGNEIYAFYNEGIYKSEIDNNSWSKVLEPGTFKFANDSEVLLKFFVIDNDYYVLYGESGVRLMKYSTGNNQAPGTAREKLKIYALGDNDAVRIIITEFQLKHPEIDVVFEIGETSKGAATVADSIRALNAKILTGDGPDILVLDGLPVDSYISKGILMDLKDKIDEFSGDLHQGILNSYLKDGSIYTLPVRFGVPVFLTNAKTEEAVDSLESLVECSEKYKGIADKMTYSDAIYLLYRYFTPEIINADSSVNQESLKEFLLLLKRFYRSEGAAEYLADYPPYKDYGHSVSFALGDSQLAFENILGMSNLNDIPKKLKDAGGKMVSSKESFSPIGLLGINNASSNKDPALLFLETAFSDEVQSIKSAEARIGFPVRNSVLESLGKLDYSKVLTAVGSKTGKHLLESRMFNQEEATEMVELAKRVNHPWRIDEAVYQIFEEETLKCLKDANNIDDTINKISNRLELYLAE